ncbi:MAG: hypothetical protein WCO56_25865 [Verrucomicrobiota bacterium]
MNTLYFFLVVNVDYWAKCAAILGGAVILLKGIWWILGVIAKSHITPKQKEILIHAADKGDLFIIVVNGFGKWVRSGEQTLGSNDDPAINAAYIEEFDSLIARRFIEHQKGHYYRLTGKGFNRARGLKETEQLQKSQQEGKTTNSSTR